MTAPRLVIGGVSRHLGAWQPSPLKMRGVKPSVDLATLPRTFTLAGFPLDYDQGELGSCAPNSIAEQYEFLGRGKRSRLWLYWFTRAAENDEFEDGGVTIPDLIAVAHTMGAPLEELWPYDVTRYQTPPPALTIAAAYGARVAETDAVNDLDHLLWELAVGGRAVTLGFGVPASMAADETSRTGLVAVPSSSDERVGGHCVNAIGYDLDRQLVKATCHYGSTFGDGGAIWLPFAHWGAGNVADMTAIKAIA